MRTGLPIAARRHALVARVENNLRVNCGVEIRPGRSTRIVVGVSGGADSLALLLACVAIRDRSGGVDPVVVHINHQLREEADDDAAFVETISLRLGVRARVMKISPASLSGNLYANARRLRYEAIENAAREEGALYIAVAHQAEDQFETILMNLCRGCDAEGLAGMTWRREMHDDDGSLSLIRPLLDVSRAECESLCRAAGLKWRDDPSNRMIGRARARLRRDVVPVLEEMWPGSARRAGATAASLSARAGALGQIVSAHFGDPSCTAWSRSALAQLPAVVIEAGLRRSAKSHLEQCGGIDALSRDHLETVASAVRDNQRRPRVFHWPGNLRVRVTAKRVRIESGSDEARGPGTRHAERGASATHPNSHSCHHNPGEHP